MLTQSTSHMSLTSVESVSNKDISKNTEVLVIELNVNMEEIKVTDIDKPVTDYTNSEYFQALGPLFTSLKICGLYYVKNKDKIISPQQVYCCLFSTLPWILLATEIITLVQATSIDVNFMNLMMYAGFTVMCIANSLSFLRNSSNPKFIRKFFQSFEELNRYGGRFTRPSQLKKIVFVSVFVAWILFLCNATLIAYILVSTDVLNDVFAKLRIPSSDSWLKGLIIFIVILEQLQWIFPDCTEVCITAMIYREYRLFYKSFAKKVHKLFQFHGSIEEERKRFVVMARVVVAADNMLTLHHGAVLACNIINLCVLLYVIACKTDSSQMAIFITWFSLCLGDIIIVCICGILVKTAVRI